MTALTLRYEKNINKNRTLSNKTNKSSKFFKRRAMSIYDIFISLLGSLSGETSDKGLNK